MHYNAENALLFQFYISLNNLENIDENWFQHLDCKTNIAHMSISYSDKIYKQHLYISLSEKLWLFGSINPWCVFWLPEILVDTEWMDKIGKTKYESWLSQDINFVQFSRIHYF